jgi:hypothetical protein
MNIAKADETFGKSVYDSDDYQVRVTEKEDGLHVYCFRKDKDGVWLPRGFVLGSNSLWFDRRKK